MKYLGVDLGGTNIVAAIVDEDGALVRSSSTPTPRSGTASVVEAIAGQVQKVRAGEQVEYVGIGSPGTIDPVSGTVGYWSNLDMRDVPLGRMVGEAVGLPVLLENDANCAAIGEFAAGAGQGSRNMIAITLGTGVGGGAVLNGKLYTGSNYAGMEVGHFVIRQGGQPCTCGRRGCFEAYCSATALIREARNAMEAAPASLLWQLAGSREAVEGRTVIQAAEQGDEAALRVLKDYTDALGCGVASLVNIFQPDVFCIGGGLANAGEIILAPVRAILEREDYARHHAVRTRLCPAKLGNDAGLIGAALLRRFRG